MNLLNFIWFALLGITFVLWMFTWFRTLYTLNKIARARRRDQNAGYFAGIGITLQIFREFASADEHKPARRRVVVLTILVFAVILSRVLFLPTP